jgi:diguanylate cyclase (GGDEF)-like protein
LYEEVRFAAERDPLTGLRNRRMFWTMLEAMLARAHPDRPVSLAVVDIDDFKSLNDLHGHDAGDRALRHVAMRLEAGVRETDAVFRIGGEEFVLVMPGTTTEGSVAALNRIRGSIGRSRLNLPDVSVSAGLAVAYSPDMTGDDLFAAADAALFRAKRAGKNRVELAEA